MNPFHTHAPTTPLPATPAQKPAPAGLPSEPFESILLVGLPAEMSGFFQLALGKRYTCRCADTLRLALQLIDIHAPQLVFLAADALSSPEAAQLCAQATPVVVLGESAVPIPGSRVRLLPPFSLQQILQVTDALARRVSASLQEYRIDGWQLDFAAHTARKEDLCCELTPQESAALLCLARRDGRPASNGELSAAIWGPDHLGDDAALRRFMGHLRRKFGSAVVHTCPGQGYALGRRI